MYIDIKRLYYMYSKNRSIKTIYALVLSTNLNILYMSYRQRYRFIFKDRFILSNSSDSFWYTVRSLSSASYRCRMNIKLICTILLIRASSRNRIVWERKHASRLVYNELLTGWLSVSIYLSYLIRGKTDDSQHTMQTYTIIFLTVAAVALISFRQGSHNFNRYSLLFLIYALFF